MAANVDSNNLMGTWTLPSSSGRSIPLWLYRRLLYTFHMFSTASPNGVREIVQLQFIVTIDDDMLDAVYRAFITLPTHQLRRLRHIPERDMAPRSGLTGPDVQSTRPVTVIPFNTRQRPPRIHVDACTGQRPAAPFNLVINLTQDESSADEAQIPESHWRDIPRYPSAAVDVWRQAALPETETPQTQTDETEKIIGLHDISDSPPLSPQQALPSHLLPAQAHDNSESLFIPEDELPDDQFESLFVSEEPVQAARHVHNHHGGIRAPDCGNNDGERHTHLTAIEDDDLQEASDEEFRPLARCEVDGHRSPSCQDQSSQPRECTARPTPSPAPADTRMGKGCTKQPFPELEGAGSDDFEDYGHPTLQLVPRRANKDQDSRTSNINMSDKITAVCINESDNPHQSSDQLVGSASQSLSHQDGAKSEYVGGSWPANILSPQRYLDPSLPRSPSAMDNSIRNPDNMILMTQDDPSAEASDASTSSSLSSLRTPSDPGIQMSDTEGIPSRNNTNSEPSPDSVASNTDDGIAKLTSPLQPGARRRDRFGMMMVLIRLPYSWQLRWVPAPREESFSPPRQPPPRRWEDSEWRHYPRVMEALQRHDAMLAARRAREEGHAATTARDENSDSVGEGDRGDSSAHSGDDINTSDDVLPSIEEPDADQETATTSPRRPRRRTGSEPPFLHDHKVLPRDAAQLYEFKPGSILAEHTHSSGLNRQIGIGSGVWRGGVFVSVVESREVAAAGDCE
ncbi:uncharacterized protein A1O9_09085 [Exophiala aquamarina CBS 119918]|uniref:Uncharacterized protein n=1 Tax=Exophiala aquamarina CBS 119918 TaxID=1182545 RepID=A0A072P5T7_9EURO|nr:uncharacterized protein A1O9_09085 [Exophiala aquamarina CBS 119918]KEF54643.1 hypothetical protein A1O9_09085 [Exophiala aquamarina CBS 119918]